MAKFILKWTEEVIESWELEVEAESKEAAEAMFYAGENITGDEVLVSSDFIDRELREVEEVK